MEKRVSGSVTRYGLLSTDGAPAKMPVYGALADVWRQSRRFKGRGAIAVSWRGGEMGTVTLIGNLQAK
jgi:hypothetical protein